MAIFDFIRTVIRNPTMVTRHAHRIAATRRAMKAYRGSHKACAWCGRTKRLDVHHIIPVSVAPEKAADQSNMMMLCRKPQCHLIVGHDGSFGRRYVANAAEICSQSSGRQVVRTMRPTK